MRAAHEFPVHSLSGHPQRKTFLSASQDSIILWAGRDSWSKSRSLNAGNNVAQAAFTPTGERIVATLSDGVVLVWDSLTLVLESRLVVPLSANASVTAMSLSYDGQTMVLGDSAGALFLYDLPGESLLRAAQLPGTSQVRSRVILAIARQW
jgi:WD40 repeat protein